MLKLSDYSYYLPEERIAQRPAAPRDSSRLLVLDRQNRTFTHDLFQNIGSYLGENDLLVLNNTRVMPARIFGKKTTGGKVELLLLREVKNNLWECLVRPGQRLLAGTTILFNETDTFVQAKIVEMLPNGSRLVRFSGVRDVRIALKEIGKVPLPPYVVNPVCTPEDYQTVYAKHEGSIAAPTAGLHFTRRLMGSLSEKGVGFAEVTLHVGWGTFRPVRSEDITAHEMEKEQFSVSPATAEKINAGRTNRKRIVAVGTTACRALESFPEGPMQADSNWTDLFIYPGFNFQRTDALITNFHLPRSTLLMLVCAFAGQDMIMRAYDEAVKQGYRFYSFGDAMLIL